MFYFFEFRLDVMLMSVFFWYYWIYKSLGKKFEMMIKGWWGNSFCDVYLFYIISVVLKDLFWLWLDD